MLSDAYGSNFCLQSPADQEYLTFWIQFRQWERKTSSVSNIQCSFLSGTLYSGHTRLEAVPRHSPAQALKVVPEWQNKELLFLRVYLLPTKASPPSLWPAYSTLQNVQWCQGNSRGKGTFEVWQCFITKVWHVEVKVWPKGLFFSYWKCVICFYYIKICVCVLIKMYIQIELMKQKLVIDHSLSFLVNNHPSPDFSRSTRHCAFNPCLRHVWVPCGILKTLRRQQAYVASAWLQLLSPFLYTEMHSSWGRHPSRTGCAKDSRTLNCTKPQPQNPNHLPPEHRQM